MNDIINKELDRLFAIKDDKPICKECGQVKEPDYECCVYCIICGVHYSEDDPCLQH